MNIIIKRSIWNYLAGLYDTMPFFQRVSLRPTRNSIIHEIEPRLKRSKTYKLLDMGCGTGQLLGEIQEKLPQFNIDYTGVDFSKEMIDKAQGKYPQSLFLHSDVDDFNDELHKYDLIVCSHSLPYYPDQQGVIQKFNSLLKQGGILILAHGSINSAYDKVVLYLLKSVLWKGNYPSIKNMKSMLRGIFDIHKIEIVNNKLWMPSISLLVCEKK